MGKNKINIETNSRTSAGSFNDSEKGVYSIHGVTGSQYSVNTDPTSYGSNDFALTTNRRISVINQAKEAIVQLDPKKFFRKKMLVKRFPILQWMPKYSADDAIGDLIAGITVGLTVIPQALAYAGIAGLPPQAGLYGSFIGAILYIFIGSCRCVNVGPSSTSSFLTNQVAGGDWPRAVLCGLIAGIIEFAMGIFGLGFVIDFVSEPVLSGFSSAVAIMIFTGQIKSLLGIKATGHTFLQVWRTILQDIQNTRLGDTVMGVTCLIVLLAMRQLPKIKIGPKEDDEKNTCQKIFNRFLWYIGTARNFIVVVISTVVSYVLIENGRGDILKTIGPVPQGLPEFRLPLFTVPETKNETGFVTQPGETFWDMISYMNIGLLAVPLIALIETMSINKSAARGKPVDATQELLAIGAGSLVNCFVGGYPGNGSFSRGAINRESGARTPLGSLYSGVLVIIALLFLTPYFQYIPNSSLAAVIMAAVIFMVELHVIKPLWRSKRSDLIPAFACFIACLMLGIPVGTFMGIGVNMLFIMYHAARPKIQMERRYTLKNNKYLLIKPDRCLMFPSVDYVRNLINKQGIKEQLPVIIDCTCVYGADFTTATAVKMLLDDFGARQQALFFLNLKPSVAETFEGAELDMHVYYSLEMLERIVDDPKTNVDLLDNVVDDTKPKRLWTQL